MANSVALGIITNGEMRQEFVRSLLSVKEQGFTDIIVHPSGPYLDCARNYVIERWREDCPDADWLIFIDDDIEFNFQDVLRLTEDETKPINCGIYLNPFPYGLMPVVFKWVYDPRPKIQRESFVPYSLEELLSLPRTKTGLIQVAAAGTGCMAIHKSVTDKFLEKFSYPMPWFAEETINGVHQGEDLTFCARAASLGIPVTIDPTVRVGHVKYFKFHPDQIDNFIPDEKWIRETMTREEVNANV